MKKAPSSLIRFGVLLLLLVVSSTFILTCSDTSQMPSVPVTKLDHTTFSMAHPKVQAVAKVQDKYSEALLDAEDIVGTATSLDEQGNLVIKVYAATPGVANIPKTLDGIPVEVVVTGMFKIYSDPQARFARPVPIGVSTGHPDITAGTIGCRVKDASGNVYALSNNHVYADVNNASIGDNVLQPGPYDGGQDPADAIGTLHDFEPIELDGPDNYIDAAIAITDAATVGYSTPSDAYGTPSATPVSAFVGQAVQKYGRTTVWTHGEVSELNVTVDVCYITQGPVRCKSYARFVDQIAITPGTFSDGGDSGSLIVTDDANKNPVGLLFAGSDTRTLANPIHYVLDRFNVTIDDGSGGSGNIAPSADFSYAATELSVDFTDLSSDADGSVVSWSWDFGDGAGSSTAQNPTYTYAADGTYNATLTVTDNEGATDAASKDVTVSSGGSGGDITLTTTGYKVKGRQNVDLSWSGATGTQVNVYRDGALIATTDNNGAYTDNIGAVGGATYIYQICETDGSACSNESTVIF